VGRLHDTTVRRHWEKAGDDSGQIRNELAPLAKSFLSADSPLSILNWFYTSTVDGAGGDFVPPLWLVSQFVELARPGRVTADLCNTDRLPEGTDSINIPRLLTGTAVGIQGTQNTAILEQDITTDAVSSAVFTVAGGQKLSLQLVEQSPLNVDRVILGGVSEDLGRLKWFLWHGNVVNALQIVEGIAIDLETLHPDAQPSKLLKAVHEFDSYLHANARRIPNYGERRRAGEAISTAFVGSGCGGFCVSECCGCSGAG
jgi:hypothetical protein